MTIKYTGTRDNNNYGGGCKDKRFAEFTYREEESARFDKIAAFLTEQGYDIDNSVEGWAAIEVADRNEYNDLSNTFKAAKKIIH